MSTRRRPVTPVRPSLQIAGGLLVLLTGACHDSPADPLAGPTTVETVPSLSLAAPLPDLPELVVGTAPPPEVRAALAAWRDSWSQAEAQDGRDDARRIVAGHLAEVLDARGVEEALRSLLWAEVEVGERGPLPPELAVPLDEARVLTARAAEARRDGRLRDALEAGLAAADLYRSVAPESVARRLLARGQALLSAATAGTERDDGPGADVTERARHLLDGAVRALDVGDYAIAVQRAFYGIQVLEGRMHEVGGDEADQSATGNRGGVGA